MEALRNKTVDEEIDLYDDCGMLCSMEERNTLISNSKEVVPVSGQGMTEVITVDMKPYLNASPEQKAKALLKMDLVNGYETRDRRVSAKEYLTALESRFDEIKPNEAKLFRWKKAVDEAKKNGESPLVALLDSRGRKEGTISMSEEMQEMAVRMFARRDNPLRVSAIYQNMLHKFADEMCSYDVLNNFFKKWKRVNHSLYAFAQSADKWKNKYLPAMGSLSEKALYPNHYWELDSTPADIICRDGKRYTVLGMIDIYSRRVCFWVDESSNSYSIARLLRRAILKLGIPENVVIDNGKDYQSNHFDSICYNLGVGKITVPPFSGDMKPHIERMFGTLSRELFEELEGYAGHSVQDRDDIKSRRGFAHKIASQAKWREEAKAREREDFVSKFAIKKENLGLELKIPIEADKLQKIIDDWVDALYEKRVHKGIKKTPLQKWEEQAIPVKGISDPAMLDLLLGESYIRTVNKKGIQLDGACYQAVFLAEYVGEKVRIMTYEDMGRIAVYKMNYEPLGVAEDFEWSGKSRSELASGKRLGHKVAKGHAKLLEQWEEASRLMDPTIKDRIETAMERHEGKRTSTIAVAKTTEVIRAVREGMNKAADDDAKAVETSNIVNMEGEKLTPSGRPQFARVLDRMIWDLDNNRVDDSTNRLANNKPELWELALRAHNDKKIG
jgi:transposase InsO family protein